jgi:hypothetical protein
MAMQHGNGTSSPDTRNERRRDAAGGINYAHGKLLLNPKSNGGLSGRSRGAVLSWHPRIIRNEQEVDLLLDLTL